MEAILQVMEKNSRWLFIALVILCLTPVISPAIALFLEIGRASCRERVYVLV